MGYYNKGELYTPEVHRIIKEWETHKIPQQYGFECVRLFGYYVKQRTDDMANASWNIFTKFPDDRSQREQYNIGMIQDYPHQLTYIKDSEEIKKFMQRVRDDKSSKPKGLTYDGMSRSESLSLDSFEDVVIAGGLFVAAVGGIITLMMIAIIL